MRRLSFLLLILLLLLTGCGDDDDDDNNDSSDDDAADDDSSDDDDDDDTVDDDTVDDDTLDDDTLDDDTVDDDDDTPSPYDGMTPTGKAVGEILSIASHMSTGAAYRREREFEIQQEVAAGISNVRRGFYWNNIEPQDDVWTFDGYDVMVGLISEAGLNPLAMVTHTVGWAAPGGSPSEIDPAKFADFAGTVAARYADDLNLYEIWNEPNTERFWNGGADPEHYGLLLEAAYEAIHENDPTAEVMFGGMSSLDIEHLLDPRGVWNFLARTGEEHPDLCDFIDGVAIHPYTFLQQPGPELSLDILGLYRYPDLRTTIDDVRGMLEDLGCRDKPIHLTEMGWPSLLIGNDRQAAYYARGALLSAAAGVAGYYWYTFYDEEPGSTIPTEDYFGLYELPDGVTDPDPKPAYNALVALSELVGASRYAGDLGVALEWDAEDDNYAMAFVDDDGLWTIAAWRFGLNLDQQATVAIPLPPGATGAWTLYDQFGDQLDSAAVDGPVSLTIDGNVRYLQVATE